MVDPKCQVSKREMERSISYKLVLSLPLVTVTPPGKEPG